MDRWAILIVSFAVTLSIMIGCSGGGLTPVTPTADQELPAELNPTGKTQTHLWGYYDVFLDVDSKSVEVITSRSVEFTVNIVKFLNDDPLGIQFSFNGTTSGDGYVDVDLDVTIKHPLDNAGFDGYDVRGFFIVDGSDTLSYNTDLKYPVNGTDQILLNADGYSRWFNPTEFLVPGIFGYVPGNYAPPGYTGSATLNPYKYFGEGLGAADNLWSYLTTDAPNTGCFLHGSSNTRNYQVRLPIPDPGIKYGYAVTVDWAGMAPEFHPSNATEAVACRVTNNSDVYYADPTDNGGNLILDISLFGWDYQPTRIYLESTVLSAVAEFDPAVIVTGGGDHYSIYHVEIPADNVTWLKNQEYWVIAEYEGFDYTNDFGVPNDAGSDPLAAIFRYDLAINYPGGWARNWGGIGMDLAGGVATDSSGNVYVCGNFEETVDFDPDGGDLHTSYGEGDAFLAKFDASGGFEWAQTWGGSDWEWGLGVAVDGSGNVYVTGSFEGTADFDPGGGDPHTSNGQRDVFLSKFDSSGNFKWARVWGGPNDYPGTGDWGTGVAIDGSGNIYVTGRFDGTVDFDPDGGDPHTSLSGPDAFLSKFDPYGNFEWARTWGTAEGWGVAIDESGNAYVTGSFLLTADFDPDGGDPHTANGALDAFLSKFDSSGNFEWARTWGGQEELLGEYGFGVAADGYGSVYVTGKFECTVDFNPDGGDPHTSNGFGDAYLSKFDSSGNFEWARTWGGSDWEWGQGVAIDGSGNVYITGTFFGTADFDPGAGTEWRTSNGCEDVFLSKFDSSGNFEWARTWGGPSGYEGLEMGSGVAADGFGNVYVAGQFRDIVDFAPTGPPCNESPDEHYSNGYIDVFLTKHLPDGCW